MSYPQNEQFRENAYEAKMERKHKGPKGKALNAAQKASKRMLGHAGREMKKNERKSGEAPLQHLKRLIK